MKSLRRTAVLGAALVVPAGVFRQLGGKLICTSSRRWLLAIVSCCVIGPEWFEPAMLAGFRSCLLERSSGPGLSVSRLRTNLDAYPGARVPRYALFELAFEINDTMATNPYFIHDPNPPPGVEAGTGITVDALLLPPGETNWSNARVVPCFYYQPMEQAGRGQNVSLLPVGAPEWRCRFAPDAVGQWRYQIRATDAGGTTQSEPGQFASVPSDHKGYVGVSETDSRFFAFADGTPFVTPLVNVEQGSPFNTLAGIRNAVQQLGEHGIRFVRWFPTGEGANYAVAPYGDTMRINWRFGDGWVTADGADTAAGKSFAYRPYYYSAQTLSLPAGYRYRLSFRAQVAGDQVLRAQVGTRAGDAMDICATAATYHAAQGAQCTVRRDGWHDHELIFEPGGEGAMPVDVALRGLYVSQDAPAPYDAVQEGSLRVHSIRLQRDETGNGGWGANLLSRSDPDTYTYVDQVAAALLDEVLYQSELHGVYHRLTLFHKNDPLLARLEPDGSVGAWDVNNFYAAEGRAARWYQQAWVRYVVARWSYSPALHSLELANETDLDEQAHDTAFAIADQVHTLSPRPVLMSHSFWGRWPEAFWTDPQRGHLMDYADKHWYANPAGAGCDENGEGCDLISNVWDDSAAYVRECAHRLSAYRELIGYDKPILRGEGGVALSGTEPQHPDIRRDATGTYYHKKLWAHVGLLGSSCDGEWYPRLFVDRDGGAFPNPGRSLYAMFAAYERFVEGEPLSDGSYLQIGTDLAGDRQITLADTAGALRAWGAQSRATGHTVLWIDNAAHTWKAAIDGGEIASASGVLAWAGFEPGSAYEVQWWDTYATGADAFTRSIETAQPDGNLVIEIDELAHDIAVKVLAYEADQ